MKPYLTIAVSGSLKRFDFDSVMSNHFSFSRRSILTPANKLIFLVILSVILLMLDHHYSGVGKGKKYAAIVLYPMQWVSNKPVQLYDYVSNLFQSQDYLLQENQRLTADNARLKIKERQIALQTRELAELKNLAQLQQFGLVSSSTAEVVSTGDDPMSDHLIINKGTQNSVMLGDAVVDEGGLIGQITEAQHLNAKVSLITDNNIVIPVMVERTGVRTLVYGGGGLLSLRYFPTDADLQPDDVLLTSGLDSVYPIGIPVARVIQTSRNAGTPYYKVILQPSAALRSSKYVLVLPQKSTMLPENAAASDAAPLTAFSPVHP